MQRRAAVAAVASYGKHRPGALLASSPLLLQRAGKGDYGFNVFHNSNPQHGGSYARHERRMRDDEVEDFLKSVKHWVPVRSDAGDGGEATAREPVSNGDSSSSSSSRSIDDLTLPAAPPLRLGEEALMRTFRFDSYRDAYLFMGRLWAFCYGCDKYPPVQWEGTMIRVYLFSASFRGISKREARVAAFLNDQYNMLQKAKKQQHRIVADVVQESVVEGLIGTAVAERLAAREERRRAPLQEVKQGPQKWSDMIDAAPTDSRGLTSRAA